MIKCAFLKSCSLRFDTTLCCAAAVFHHIKQCELDTRRPTVDREDARNSARHGHLGRYRASRDCQLGLDPAEFVRREPSFCMTFAGHAERLLSLQDDIWLLYTSCATGWPVGKRVTATATVMGRRGTGVMASLPWVRETKFFIRVTKLDNEAALASSAPVGMAAESPFRLPQDPWRIWLWSAQRALKSSSL